jgi:hypothetical protein
MISESGVAASAQTDRSVSSQRSGVGPGVNEEDLNGFAESI